MELKDEIKITDKRGFIYYVTVRHHPGNGFSIAYHDDLIIASREYGKMMPPTGDNDGEWERWEERFREWVGAAMVDLECECKIYFDKLGDPIKSRNEGWDIPFTRSDW